MTDPTLLELLKSFAVHHQERATAEDELGFSKWIHADLANQARAAAARLRREMELAAPSSEQWNSHVTAVLTRVNNGPLKP